MCHASTIKRKEERWGRGCGMFREMTVPRPEESSPNRYGFASEDLLSLSNYSMRNVVGSGSRGEMQHGGSHRGLVGM